ncbi:MAG: hypothetical protein HQM15_03470 [Deltaproteobacteria bacterium]|nr:hypothetical protein [Deltaproteobacteria bacterium]
MENKDVFLITEQVPLGDKPAKTIWTKIGVAFVNRDQSLNVLLDALPLHGKLHIRDRKMDKKQNN